MSIYGYDENREDLRDVIDPVTLERGISPRDAVKIHNCWVSRSALLMYIEEEQHKLGLGIRLFDGLPLTDDDLVALAESAEASHKTSGYRRNDEMSGSVDLDSMTIVTGAKARSFLQKKIAHNTREMKAGTLKGGAGKHPKVHSRAQMLAISYAEAAKHAHKGRRGGGSRKSK